MQKKNNSKICFFFNYNPLYRLPIYKTIDGSFDCDFYFGDGESATIKQFDPKLLNGFKGILHYKRIKHTWFSFFCGITKIFKSEYKQYVITGDVFNLSLWLLLIYCKFTGKKVYNWTHGVYSPLNNIITRNTHRLFNRLFSGAFMYNSYACQYMKDLGFKESQLYVIHNSLDTDLQTAEYERHPVSNIYSDHFDNSYPVVLYIGRIQKRKKLDLLVEAVASLNENNRFVNLVIVGDYSQDTEIQQMVKDKGLSSNVWFYGASYEEHTNAELIYNAHVCVCPEKVGLTAIHSLSYGTPVISNDSFNTQMPEFESIVDGVTGSFYKTGNIYDLATKILKWCLISDEGREETRLAARREITNEWSVPYQINVLEHVLSNSNNA